MADFKGIGAVPFSDEELAPLPGDEGQAAPRQQPALAPLSAEELAPLPQSKPATFSAQELAPIEPVPLLIENTSRAADTTPTQAAFDRNLENTLGLPQGVITSEERPDLTKSATQRQIDTDTLEAPVTRDLLSRDRLLTSLASDSIDVLVQGERLAKRLTFGEASSAVVDNLQATAFRALEFVGEATGIDTIADVGTRGAKFNEAQAQTTLAGRGKRFAELETVGDYLQWMKVNAPHIISSVPALAGAAAGSAVGLATPLPGGAVIGGIVGALVPSLILGYGQVQGAVKARDPNAKAVGTVFLAGSGVALFDSVLPFRAGTALRKAMGLPAAEMAIKLIGLKLAVDTVKAATIEGATEVIQDALSEAAASFATVTDLDFKKLSEDLFESFMVGMLTGGGVGGGTSVATSLIQARQAKKGLDDMNGNEGTSKLRKRAPDKAGEVAARQMEAEGVSSMFIPAEAILSWVQQQPDSTAAMNALGITENLPNAVAAGKKIEVSAQSFSQEVFDTPGYDILAPHVSLTPEGQSVTEATEAAFSQEGIQAELATELEAFEAAQELKDRVQETVTKALADPPSAAQIIEEAGPQVERTLDALLLGIEERKVDVTETLEAGRLALLDDEISVIEEKIAVEEEAIERKQAGNEERSPSKQLKTSQEEARIQRLAALRDAKVDEQLEINLPAQQAPISEEAQADLEAGRTAKLAKKDIKTRGQKLVALGVKATKERRLAARRAFAAAAKANIAFTKQKHQVNKIIEGMALEKQDIINLTSRISAIGNPKQFKKKASIVMARASAMVERKRKRDLGKALVKLVGKNKPKLTGKPKGKLTPEISTFMLDLARIFKGTRKDAGLELIKATNNPTDIPTSLEKIKNMVLAAHADPDNMNVTRLEDLLLSMQELIADASKINKSNAFARAVEENDLRQRFIEALDPVISRTDKVDADGNLVLDEDGNVVQTPEKRGRKGRAAEVGTLIEGTLVGQSGAWWNKLLRVMRTKDGKEANDIVDRLSFTDESITQTLNRQMMIERFETAMIEKVPGLKTPRDILKMMQRLTVEKVNLGKFINERGERVPLSMKRAELIQLVSELQNADIEKKARVGETESGVKGDAYSEDMITALRDAMTEEDTRIMEVLTEFYDGYYPRINAAYESAEGISLAKEEVYIPISRNGDTDTNEFLKSILFRGNVSSGSFAARTGSVRPLRRRNAFQVMQSHVAEMEYYIAFHDKVRLINAVFDGQTMGELERVYGPGGLVQSIRNDVDYFGKKGVLNADVGEKFFIQLMRNFSVAQLGASGVITIKQWMSFPAFAEKVGTVDFIAGLGHLIAHPKQALDILNETDQFRTRGDRRDQDFVDLTADQFGNRVLNVLGRNPRLAAVLTLNIKVGDKMAIGIGGYAHYHAMKKQLKAKGMKEPQAHKDALASMVKIMRRTQQSPDIDQQSQWQRSSAFPRLLTQFMSSANSLTRAEYGAAVEFARGRSTPQEFAKAMVIYHLLIPNLIQLAANFFQWDWEDQGRASLFGAMNGLFVFGDLIEGTINAAIGADEFFQQEIRHPLAVFSEVLEVVSNLDEGISWADVIDGQNDVVRLLKSASGITGLPIAKIYNMARGVNEITDGQVPKGLALVLGYSPYTVDKVLD